jgi:hypothetical protein
MIVQPDAHILNACKALFGPATSVSPSFLLSLKPRTVKTAFRKKAMETHPDLFTNHDPQVQRLQAEMFRVVNNAYEIMRRYCERRDRRYSRAVLRAPDPARRPAPATTQHFRVDEQGWLYQGVVPERRLEIGRYLYYRGSIPYHILLRALAWQMRQRPAMGIIARQWGWLNDEQIRSILGLRTADGRFGQRAMRLGLLSSYQARILLGYQRTLQKKLGQYFIEHGYLTRTEIELLAADLNRHNARFPIASVTDWTVS